MAQRASHSTEAILIQRFPPASPTKGELTRWQGFPCGPARPRCVRSHRWADDRLRRHVVLGRVWVSQFFDPPWRHAHRNRGDRGFQRSPHMAAGAAMIRILFNPGWSDGNARP